MTDVVRPGTADRPLEIQSATIHPIEGMESKHRADAQDISPTIAWGGVPEGTRSLMLVADDPDSAQPPRTHWLVYNIPARADRLPENLDHRGVLVDGTCQGKNDFQEVGWHGPDLRSGASGRIRFQLFALDTPLQLEPAAARPALDAAMEGHVLASATLVSSASRPASEHLQ